MKGHQDFHFETGFASDTGKVREVNEDNWYANEGSGVWLVADGMGGYTNGKFASHTIVECARSVGQPASAPDLLARFKDRMMRANDLLIAFSANRGDAMLGSTLASVLVYGRQFACVWAGDSRAYLLRNGVLSQISHDHSEVQGLLDQGLISKQEARGWPRKNVITRAIGVSAELELDTIHGQVSEGDRFILCSDGLTGHVYDEEICEIAAGSLSQDACNRLIELTLERGATDNVTVVIAQCGPAHGGPGVASAGAGGYAEGR